MRERWRSIPHDPVWVAAPLKVDQDGNTEPGFLCIYDLENGRGLCAGNVFELPDDDEDNTHYCTVKLRRWNISRPCYDKPRRCPGWAGGGWKSAQYSYCYGGRGYLGIDYESGWEWKTHRCPDCGVVVLPYMIRWTSPRSWWYEVRFARNSWKWLFRLETWWGKK